VLRPSNVRVDDPLTENRVLDVRLIHRTEYGSLKTIRLGVVKLLEVSNCLLLLVLEI
jgi:hypothetical protein